MKKLLILFLSISIIGGCKKEENDPTPVNPETQYPTLILGSWKLTSSKVYYTPTGGGAVTFYDATAEEGDSYYKFNSSNVVDISVTLGGTPNESYNYSFSGSNLAFNDLITSDVFNLTIQNLTATQLKWQQSNGSGTTLTDSLNNTLGTINYGVAEFVKQ